MMQSYYILDIRSLINMYWNLGLKLIVYINSIVHDKLEYIERKPNFQVSCLGTLSWYKWNVLHNLVAE